MADMGILPSVFGTRSSHGTPTVGILLSLLGTLLLLSFMSFSDIMQSANALYGLGMLLELAAFLHLRLRAPHLHRPFRIPMGFFGCLLMCSPPCALLLFVLSLSSLKVAAIAGVATIVGILLYIGLRSLNQPSWMMKFAAGSCNLHTPVTI
jgi:amino acid transporter